MDPDLTSIVIDSEGDGSLSSCWQSAQALCNLIANTALVWNLLQTLDGSLYLCELAFRDLQSGVVDSPRYDGIEIR